jgi:hypothetical protein
LELFSPTRSATTSYKPKTKELNNPKSYLQKKSHNQKSSFPKKTQTQTFQMATKFMSFLPAKTHTLCAQAQPPPPPWSLGTHSLTDWSTPSSLNPSINLCCNKNKTMVIFKTKTILKKLLLSSFGK